jgi:hypothetical protein
MPPRSPGMHLLPLADDRPDTPAHWSVTLAVADADAAAERAV